MEKVAFIIDGAFFVKRYKSLFLKEQPITASDVESCIKALFSFLKGDIEYSTEIYRIFYYDCPPLPDFKKSEKHSKMSNSDFQEIRKTFRTKATEGNKFHNELKTKDYFALRLGELRFQGWGRNWNPHLKQKGVDVRMGLDIASITAKKLCTKLVLISGDTDMIPAMKTARKEGVQVYWWGMGMKKILDFFHHSDLVISDDFYKKHIHEQLDS